MTDRDRVRLMTGDDANDLAREIVGNIIRARGNALVMGRPFDSSDMVRVARETLLACQPPMQAPAMRAEDV